MPEIYKMAFRWDASIRQNWPNPKFTDLPSSKSGKKNETKSGIMSSKRQSWDIFRFDELINASRPQKERQFSTCWHFDELMHLEKKIVNFSDFVIYFDELGSGRQNVSFKILVILTKLLHLIVPYSFYASVPVTFIIVHFIQHAISASSDEYSECSDFRAGWFVISSLKVQVCTSWCASVFMPQVFARLHCCVVSVATIPWLKDEGRRPEGERYKQYSCQWPASSDGYMGDTVWPSQVITQTYNYKQQQNINECVKFIDEL